MLEHRRPERDHLVFLEMSARPQELGSIGVAEFAAFTLLKNSNAFGQALAGGASQLAQIDDQSNGSMLQNIFAKPLGTDGVVSGPKMFGGDQEQTVLFQGLQEGDGVFKLGAFGILEAYGKLGL
jgi:hypothetical protein